MAIDRTDANALIPQPVSTEIIKETVRNSAILQLARKVPMSSKTYKQPVLSVLPTSAFVDGDTGHAPQSGVEWKNVMLTAETIKTAIVVPKEVIADSAVPMWDEIRPLAAEAIGKTLDMACLFGVGKPATFPSGIVPGAIAAGNVVARGTATKGNGGLYKDLIDMMFKSIGQGFRVSGFAASDLFEQYLLGSFDTNGRPLADLNAQEKRILGRVLAYAQSDIWPQTGDEDAEVIAGDWTKAAVGIRSDISYTVVTEGVVSDPTDGKILINLPQQGMVELILDARFGFAIANPVTRQEATEADRFPFSVLTSPAAP